MSENEKTGIYNVDADGCSSYSKQRFVNGIRHALYKKLYANGKYCCEINCVGYQTHELFETWYENGRQKTKYNFVAGQLHGLQLSWDVRKDVADTDYYFHGAQITEQEYNEKLSAFARVIEGAVSLDEKAIYMVISQYAEELG